MVLAIFKIKLDFQIDSQNSKVSIGKTEVLVIHNFEKYESQLSVNPTQSFHNKKAKNKITNILGYLAMKNRTEQIPFENSQLGEISDKL